MKTLCSRGNGFGGLFAVFALALCVQPGCASVRSSQLAMPADPVTGEWRRPGSKTPSGLVVSGEEKTQYATEHFGVLDVTFENTTAEWVRVKGLALDFGGPEYERHVRIPVGEELRSWATATQERLLIERHNRAMALGAVALAGMTTAAVTNNRAVRVAGATVASGSIVALGVDSMNQEVERVEQPATPQNASYYESHLLSVPFSVAPGLFTKRWVTINTAGGDGAPCVTGIRIDYQLDGGTMERVWLPFRKGAHNSDWQRRACRHRRQYANGTYAND